MRDEEYSGLAHPKGWDRAFDKHLEVRAKRIVLGQAHGHRSPVASKFSGTDTFELVQSPDHARRTKIERGQPRKPPDLFVVWVRRPQRALIKRGLGTSRNRGDRRTHT